jgi:hypothetical protein
MLGGDYCGGLLRRSQSLKVNGGANWVKGGEAPKPQLIRKKLRARTVKHRAAGFARKLVLRCPCARPRVRNIRW